jgi:hypothetical protein
MDEDQRMPVYDLLVEDFESLLVAARPLWDELERLGWVDSYGGMEFKRVFPKALDFIHEQANTVPS